MDLSIAKNGQKLIDAKTKTLAKFYADAYDKLILEIQRNKGTLWQKEKRKSVLAAVDAVVANLDTKTKEVLKKDVPAVYFAFAEQAKKNLKKITKENLKNFGQIHTQAVEAMTDDAYLKFARTMQGLKVSVNEMIKVEQQEAIRATLVQGTISGKARTEIAGATKDLIEQQGITSLVDKSGKKWALDRYADMLTRTVLAQAARQGVTNTARENGFDLVQITTHGADDSCRFWEGKIVSLDGKTKGFPTMADAEGSGEIFHVNCRHSYFAITEDVASKQAIEQSQELSDRVSSGETISNYKALKDPELKG